MATIILMWKPTAWPWLELPAMARAVAAGIPCEQRWSVGGSKNIDVGSRAFILRVGNDRPGFVASGWVSESPRSHPHWDAARAAAGELTNYVQVSLDAVHDPDVQTPLDWRTSDGAHRYEALKHLRGSGKSISVEAAKELEGLWAQRVSSGSYIGRLAEEPEGREGEITYRLVTHRSRERSLRRAKISAAMRQGSLRCEVPGCGFDFALAYGDVGHGFAHVHHLKPLATLDGEQSVTLGELAIVCANCHAMVHRGGACRDLTTLIRRPADIPASQGLGRE